MGTIRRLVDSPLSTIRTARQFLFHAWMLYDAVQRGAITPATFANEFIVEGATLARPPADRTPHALNGWAWNTVLAGMSISAMAADQAMDATFGFPRPRDRTPLQAPDEMSDRDAARTIMYMLRSAYAHDTLNPRWVCGPRYLGAFHIAELGFTLDTTVLNGQPWNIAYVGGAVTYFNLLAYCQNLVAVAERRQDQE